MRLRIALPAVIIATPLTNRIANALIVRSICNENCFLSNLIASAQVRKPCKEVKRE
jgi:hypothetical protein